MTETDHSSVRREGAAVVVTIEREAKRNAISPGVTSSLWSGLRELEGSDARALVITAVGDYFSAGIDLNAIPGERDGARIQPGSEFRRAYAEHHALYDAFEACEKPIVLAAQGHCLGAGLEMALSCDFRLASSDATFALPEIRLGLIAGSGGTSRLTKLVGPHWAKWLAMAGQTVDAAKAERIGLVHDVRPAESFRDDVMRFVEDLASIPMEALGLAKLAVNICDSLDLANARHVERITNTMLWESEEFAARSARFRRPRA